MARKSSTIASLIIAAVLAFSGCTVSGYAGIFAPKDAVYYSETQFKTMMLNAIGDREEKVNLKFIKDEQNPVGAFELSEATKELLDRSGRCAYSINQISHICYDKLTFIEYEAEIVYSDAKESLHDIPKVSDKLEAVNFTVDWIESGHYSGELVLWTDNPDITEADIENIAITADNNAFVSCEATTIWTNLYCEGSGDSVIIIEYERDIDDAKMAGYFAEMSAAAEKSAAEIRALGIEDTRELVKAVHDEVVYGTYYDYDLRDTTRDGALTEQEKIRRTPYGALVEGRTVCSGYSYAFKEICDRVGIQCWVVAGESNGDGHVWNMVRIDEKSYYVDCTFDDTGGGSYYFLFTDSDRQCGEYIFAETNVLPW